MSIEQKLPDEASGITTKDGLLWKDGKIIGLPRADIIAEMYGYWCAERLVTAMEEAKKEKV